MDATGIAIHFDAVEPPPGVAVRAKLVVMHGLGGTGRMIQRHAQLDYLASKCGVRIYYPTAFGHNWQAQHGLDVAAGQLGRLNAMVNQSSPAPTIWAGYSDGCEMAQLCVIAFANDHWLAGGIFYAGHLHAATTIGTRPVLLCRNVDDHTISAADFAQLGRTWAAAGNPVTALAGRGDHMALWDTQLNPLIETWLQSALEAHSLPVPA